MWGRMRSSSLKPRPPEEVMLTMMSGHFSRTRPTVFSNLSSAMVALSSSVRTWMWAMAAPAW